MLKQFDEAQIARVLRYETLIPAMERALAAYSTGEAIQPVRNLIKIEEGKRYFGAMPAIAPDAMGAKLVTFYPANAGTQVPTHTAQILLFDTATGEPLAAMDGRLITEMRTAALSAAVTRLLVPSGVKVLAILGSGVQAGAHLEAMRHVRDFDEVRVWSRTPAHAETFAKAHGVTATTAEEAARGADVIVAATAAIEPVLRGAWLKPGAHVNSVGSPLPTWRELDDDAMRNSAVIVDSREGSMKECGDVILSGAAIHAEAGELFAGTKEKPSGRTTVFRSVGMAIEDIAAAKLVYDALR